MQDDDGVSDKVTVITGGAKGIGAGCARVFCDAGAKVTILDRDKTAGQVLAAELNAQGWNCSFELCDVDSPDQIQQAIDRTTQRFGQLDCLINNAARFTGWKQIDEIGIELLRQVLDTNVVAYFATSRIALPYLRASKGCIINIASIVGAVGAWHDSAYAASKGAVIAMTKALAIDESIHGVRVNAVLPGNILTANRSALEAGLTRREEFHEFVEGTQWLGRSGTTEEVARVCKFLAGRSASYLTGIALPVTGGLELGYGPKRPLPDFE
jgi:NAD(P)-dependent dehydrogenase (short-subunit alcohol dehydrogenase family)